MKKALCFLIFLFSAFIGTSQMAAQDAKGKIAGKMIDSATGEGLIGATVQIRRQSRRFGDRSGWQISCLSLAPGTYHPGVAATPAYQTQKMEVEVKPDEVSYVNIVMKESENALTEVVITYTIEKSSALALLTERKNAAAWYPMAFRPI